MNHPGDGISPDFRAVFEASPDAYLVLSPDLTIVAVNDNYLKTTRTSRDEVIGRPLFDVLRGDPSDPQPAAVANIRASLARVLTERRPHAMSVQRYPIRKSGSNGDEFEERYWSPVNTPVLSAAGRVAYIIHRIEDVTELVRLKREKLEQEQSLQRVTASSERYSQLLDTAPDAIVIVSEDGRIQLVNVQTEALFGYSREELTGQPLDILIPERFRKGHIGHMSRYLADPGPRPMGSGLELYGRRKDASEIPIEVSLSPQRGADGMPISAAIRDISERRRLEAAARLTADRLKSAVESIEDAFALFDAEDRLILCNSVFRGLVHESDGKAPVGKRYGEILEGWIHDIDFPNEGALERFRQERLSQRLHEQTSTFDIRMRDGRSLRVRDRRTAEGGIVKIIWDLTEDQRRAQELREARSAAEAASAAKSEFLSSMSHELRTPLNAILGFAQLLERDKRQPLSERHKERVQQILRGGEHLLHLIDDILDLSRIEGGRVTISLEAVEVAEVLREVQTTLGPLAARQGVQVEIEPLPEPSPFVEADRTRFAQILINFGTNAIKYNREGGKATFALDASHPERLRVTVTDTGIGIPLDKQEKLFQPFQRAGQETGPIEGTGIGLVITKRLAELMGGTVGFRSVAGEGSVFWVEMSIPEVAPRQIQLALAREAESAKTLDGAQRLILYVEDNPANVVFMRDLVSSFENVDLITAPTAELGIELARVRHPRVIVMDINLPGMSGLDALMALRRLPETRDIPVIALTAAASERDRQRGTQAGFHRYLTKPVKVDEFEAVVEELLASD